MQITLRRASALQNAVRQQIGTIQVGDSAEISALANLPVTVEAKRDELLARYNRKRELIKALYALRTSIGKANAEAGIDALLTRSAHTQALIELHLPLASAKVREDADLLDRRAKRAAALPEANAFARTASEMLTVAVLLQEDILKADAEVKSLRRLKTDLADELATLNAKTCIVMDEATAAVLKTEGLI